MSDGEESRSSWSRVVANLAWPVVSLACIGISVWLLQVKLEAEVSSDPSVRAALADGAFWENMKVVSNAIADRLMLIPLEGYVLSMLATFVAYAALAWYDRISLLHLGCQKGISWLYVGASSFVAYALGHNIGASVVSSGAVRLRAYSAKGLSKKQVAGLVTMSTFTFALGVVLSLGMVFVSAPGVVAPLGELVTVLAIPESAVRLVGAGLIGLTGFYIMGSALHLPPLRIGTFRIAYPRLGVVVRQLLAGPMELVAAAGIVYFALPSAGNPGFLLVFGAFLLSFVAGLVTQVPGGIGVMEAVFLALMPDMSAASVMAALLVWRLLYLLIPLAVSGPLIVAFEFAQFRRRS